MLLELVSHLLSFDFAWVAMLILGNLHWVFALFAYTFISGEGHNALWAFVSTVIFLYAFVDLFGLLGWIFVPIGIFLVLQFVLSFFFENTRLEKHYLLVVVMLFVILSFFHTFYFEFPWAV